MKTTRIALFLFVAITLICGVVAAQLPKLPEPFATPSVRNSASIVPKPDAAQLQVPAGFSVSVFADNIEAPRTMMYAPNGDLFVAQSRLGTVLVLRDTNKDGVPDTRSVYAKGLNNVFGMALHNGYLYLGRTREHSHDTNTRTATR